MKIKELEKIKLVLIVSNDIIKKSDSVICLEGDGYSRIEQTIGIFKQGLADNIVLSGGYHAPPFCVPAQVLIKKLLDKEIPKSKIIIEERSQNTFEQGHEVMEIAKAKKWKKIILVASHFHQPRAYFTFIKAMKDSGLKIQIFNASVRELPWFSKTSLGLNRLELLEEEFRKIEKYQRSGHVATFKEVIEYQKWREKQK